jgi:hypothetical protein
LFERTAPTACVVYEQPRTSELPEQSATSAQTDSAAERERVIAVDRVDAELLPLTRIAADERGVRVDDEHGRLRMAVVDHERVVVVDRHARRGGAPRRRRAFEP